MQRRELFRLLGAGATLPVFDSTLLAAFQDAHPNSTYTLRTLNPHQNATVVTMTEGKSAALQQLVGNAGRALGGGERRKDHRPAAPAFEPGHSDRDRQRQGCLGAAAARDHRREGDPGGR